MPQGIKLSNQLYPATGSKILTLAEYIHDSEWEENDKDLQSINANLKDRISVLNTSITNTANNLNDDLVRYINNVIEGALNAIYPGTGLTLTQRASLELDSNGRIKILTNEPDGNGEISGISHRVLSICPTIYSYLNYNENYPGVIKGFLRGDVNEDGQVNISDITNLVTMILNGETPEGELVINMYSKGLDSFNEILEILNLPTNIKKVKIKVKSYGTIIDNNNSEVVSLDNTYLENYISMQSYSNREASGADRYFKIEIVGYYNNIQDNNELVQYLTDSIKCNIYIIDNNGEDTFILETIPPENSQQFPILMNVDIKVEEGSEYLKFPLQGGSTGNSVNVSDVTSLITYILIDGKTSWDDDYYSYFSDDGFYLYDTNNQRLPISSGIIYLAVDTTENKTYYFISKNQYPGTNTDKLYPFKVNSYNIDRLDIILWLESTVLVDEDNSKYLENPTNFIGSFVNLSSSSLLDLYNIRISEENPNFNIFDTKKVINVARTNTVSDLLVFPYIINYVNYDTDLNTTVYDSSYIGEYRMKVYLDSNSPVKLVNNLGEFVNSIEYTNINSMTNSVVIPIVFTNNDLSKYEYINELGGYYLLKEDIKLNIDLNSSTSKNELTLNCKLLNI